MFQILSVVDMTVPGTIVDLEISNKSNLPPLSTLIEIPKIVTPTVRISNETIRLQVASSRESTRTIRAILQDSLTPPSSIHQHEEAEIDEGDTHSILSIERPHSPVLAALLRAYQEAQDSNEDGNLKSIPMSSSSRTITLKDPILVRQL